MAINRIYHLLFCLVLIWGTSLVQAQIHILPKPQHLHVAEGKFLLNERTVIQISKNNSGLQASAEFIRNQIKQSLGIDLKIKVSDGLLNNVIQLQLLKHLDSLGKEGYTLKINKKGIQISAFELPGLLYGMQSFRQLFPLHPNSKQIEFTHLNIVDFPQFKWRGLNLDCCRHFMDKQFILRYLDLLSYYKLNTFHWHLTEDQGWRIEIKKYPKLTSTGAWRTEPDGSTYGGYYTQEDIREVVSYASKLHIMVIPEIEMPGHSMAAIAAYPELSCTKEQIEVSNSWGVFKDIYCAGDDHTFDFIEGVLTEVMELFPAPYIHIGGDEAPKYRWEHCDKCKLRMEQEKLKDAHELQSYFIKRIEKFVNSRGKKIIGWDEILEGGLAPNATVQSWRGVQGAIDAVKNGNDAIVSPTSHLYFDYGLKSIDLERVYEFNPIPEGINVKEATHILGSECNMWTERAPQETIDSKLFPRILAMSEILWLNPNQKNYKDFKGRLNQQYLYLNKIGVKYGYESQPVKFEIKYLKDKGGFEVEMINGQKGLKIQYTLDGTNPDRNSPVYEKPFVVKNSCVIKARVFNNNDDEPEIFSRTIISHEGVGKPLQMKYPPSQFYRADGPISASDGQKGSIDFHDGLWLGLQEHDIEVVIDLEQVKEVKQVQANFLRAMPSWILYPEYVEVLGSKDGIEYISLDKKINQETQQSATIQEQTFVLNTKSSSVRYIKLIAKKVDVCPGWHEAAGSKAWIFMDEIIIK